jgi:hypothetical protein
VGGAWSKTVISWWLLLSGRRLDFGSPVGITVVPEEDREQRSRAECSHALRQPSVLSPLKTPTSGHHDAAVHCKDGIGGSDDSDSLPDRVGATVRVNLVCASGVLTTRTDMP